MGEGHPGRQHRGRLEVFVPTDGVRTQEPEQQFFELNHREPVQWNQGG